MWMPPLSRLQVLLKKEGKRDSEMYQTIKAANIHDIEPCALQSRVSIFNCKEAVCSCQSFILWYCQEHEPFTCSVHQRWAEQGTLWVDAVGNLWNVRTHSVDPSALPNANARNDWVC